MLRATTTTSEKLAIPFDIVVLTHEERHLRRKVLTLQHGDEVLVDLPKAVVLVHGDRLVLDDGRNIEVIAAEEPLMDVRAAGGSLTEIAWHIGNRHIPAQIEADRILLQRDHVLRDMLIGLGATVVDVSEPFEPVRGAYHRHGTALAHGHHNHDHAATDPPS
ncbi:MAG: urease accessory protein UreE [Hyphomicrobiaceae bacterium]